ncbi:protein N-terminal asparagine amidohydrolase-like [Zootermopsis nevadensis]|uniref:Protein N-terminal asparagine amidohydrolase n=1 Tax=Zootermopsis nevadensis TaxID=136037 RepID=A0A067RUQ3_ZOONE|nr:protein N-terminal asparagine amidohydrolase-like [Zootermopsis nevadensis]KDR24540.1 Protein N-terminal asparagine amidohydrolase [Zootermopsis nevadensis]
MLTSQEGLIVLEEEGYVTCPMMLPKVPNGEVQEDFKEKCRMVLVLSGVLQEEVPPNTRTLFHNQPFYKDSASQLLAIPTKVVGSVGLLYVQQRELAVTVPHDKNVNILGSDDVTTCIVALRHSGKCLNYKLQ